MIIEVESTATCLAPDIDFSAVTDGGHQRELLTERGRG